jgi:hypothetical protein
VRKLLLIAVMLLALAPPAAARTWLDGEDTTPPVVTVPGDSIAEAENASGAEVSFEASAVDDVDGAVPATCTPPSGGVFAIATTSVTCTATDSSGNTGDASFNVTVADTTAPNVTPPASVSQETEIDAPQQVDFGNASAVDAVDGSALAAPCTPAAGSSFPVGTTTVSCTATDAHGNTGQASFTVTVVLVDHTDPVLTVPSDIAQNTESASGESVSYTATATDNLDSSPALDCGDHPPSGSNFPVGMTVVTCTATDAHGNSATESFNVTLTLVDDTKPALSVPSSFSVDTEVPSGATVTYDVSASDNLDTSVAIDCNHPSGSAFPLGGSTVTCTATDDHGNTDSGLFTVTVVLVDHTAPTLTGLPGTIQREANGPLGSTVNYTLPTASDNLDAGPLLVTCAPAPGERFALGTTTVRCAATDAHVNEGAATFSVAVVDTTKPVLTPPGDRNVYATTPTGIPRDDPLVGKFLNGGTATDIVDKSLFIGNNAPEFLPVGATIVTFSTADDSGNIDAGTATITVFPMPPAGTTPRPLPQPPERHPPDDVKNLKAQAASRKVTLTWNNPTAAGFDHVTITRTLPDATAAVVGYSGKATRYVDKSVQNGVEYRYTAVAFDSDGNRSGGVVVSALPRQLLLLTPRDGARVKATKEGLKLSWARIKGADYYNLQLFLIPDLLTTRGLASTQAGVKVLTAWPKKTTFVLKRSWRFEGRGYRLKPGLYRWFVWPGYGVRNAAKYGPLMGRSTFLVIR